MFNLSHFSSFPKRKIDEKSSEIIIFHSQVKFGGNIRSVYMLRTTNLFDFYLNNNRCSG
jgi:hypothetical protein